MGDDGKILTRTRASERAISAALSAAIGAGLSVHKMLITGGKVEIQFGAVETDDLEQEVAPTDEPTQPANGGRVLKEW